MQITVVALMCHALASIPQPVCREEIVVKDEMPMSGLHAVAARDRRLEAPLDL